MKSIGFNVEWKCPIFKACYPYLDRLNTKDAEEEKKREGLVNGR